ncbi:hypothetical protein ABPG77_001628 [Micractinium sp. CCAP 211/92]
MQAAGRPALLGMPLRSAGVGAARRRGGASGALRVQALKIKWNQAAEKMGSDTEESKSKTDKAPAEEGTRQAQQQEQQPKAAAAPTTPAAAAAAQPKAEAAGSAAPVAAKAAKAAAPAAAAPAATADEPATAAAAGSGGGGKAPAAPSPDKPSPQPPAKAAVEPPPPATNGARASNGASGLPSPAKGAEAKLAVAAKISAARMLARKLAEEKQAALAASRLASAKAVDPEAAKQMIQNAEDEVAELAKEAAKADAMARAAKAAELGQAQQLELQRLKSENEALQKLLVQLAADRESAERKLAEVKQQYSGVPAEKEALAAELDTGTMPAKLAEIAAASAPPPPQAAKPPPPETAKPKPALLQQMAERAMAQGQRVFVVPEGGAPVGQTVVLYYERTRGPLPGNADIGLKVGFNKWESMDTLPMERCPELRESLPGPDWWRVALPLPELLFRVDFVTVDARSGAVDNNGGRDFQLALRGACTEQDLQLRRLELLERYEAQRMQELRAEEDRIYNEWMRAAESAAQEARMAYHERRRQQLMQEAGAVVAERRGAAIDAFITAQSKDGVFGWPLGPPEAGGSALLVYNKLSGQLRNSPSTVFVHVGYDGWWLQDKRVIAMSPLGEADSRKYNLPPGQWVGAEVPAWNTAAMLDFVFTDDRRAMWDNNNGRDYHTLLRNPASGDKLVKLVYEALDTATSADTVHQEELAAKRVLDKAHVKATAARRRRELRSRTLFTKPLTPVAGQPVEIYYNPDETALRGRPEVYVTGGFNRWTHPEKFAPVQMQSVVPGGIGWYKATVQVPEDAHVVDFAFLDTRDQQTGFYDNNKGLDYHIPVQGGRGSMPTLRVVHVAAEMAPIAKEGGLGDVVTALGRAVQDEGHDVEVVLPKYDCINYNLVQDLRLAKDYYFNGVQVKIWKGVVEGLRTTFLEPCNGYFWVGRIYTDIWRDRERFYYWCNCALEYIKHHADARQPDIVHCHDWQSAPVAWLDHGSAKCAFTIHNLNYGADLIGQAMAACEVATTVSPTYAQEVSGHPAIAPHHGKFWGIRNGIDPDIWDPAEDPLLPRGYTADSVVEGKAAAKAELRKRMQLSNADVPIVGCVTRLTHQKGIHLIKHAAWRALERGAQFVLLGSAPDPKVQAEFNQLANELARQYPDRARLWFAYDEPLSHLIYAGCDIFLVPSMFEPCGLTQMIAMRYGTVPVVRKTGGLNDTVFDVDDDQARAAALGMEVNGFSFEGMDAPGMDYALNRALTRYFGERGWWNDLAKRCMQIDWSWNSPALDYLELYYHALKKL